MPKTLHFLHIGKTGGSAIKEALKRTIKNQEIYKNENKIKDNIPYDIKNINNKFEFIILHGHNTSLTQVPESDSFFFCIRDPLSRYVSGFYSRQREGRPRYNSPWNVKEKKAFQYFESPNDLGEALSSTDLKSKQRAKQAMKGIMHIKNSLSKWIIDQNYFDSRRRDLLYILEQKTLTNDFEELIRRIDFHENIKLSNDKSLTHQSSTIKSEIKLSPLAISNLRKHYAKDYALYEHFVKIKQLIDL